MFAFDNVLVHFGTACYVVGLHGQHLLQCVGCAVCFQRPNLHLTETLATELSFTAQRLLSNQTVRTGRTRVHFFVNQVVQLQIVHHTYCYLAVKRFARASVIQCDLGFAVVKAQFFDFRIIARISQIQHFADFRFFRTIKYRRCERCTFTQIGSQFDDFFISQGIQIFFLTAAVVEFVQELAQLAGFALLFQHTVDTLADTFCRPTQVNFQNLTDVHTGRYAQRVQYDVHRTTVRHVRHVFHRQNARYHTFVTVATRHFVTGLQTAFDGDKDFHHFLYARLQFVALGQFFLLDFVQLVRFFAFLLQTQFNQF